MKTAKFWQATAEWVITAVVGGLASAYLTGGIHSWADVAAAAGGAAATALVKALGSTLRGDPQSPALVEPDPIVRILAEAPPAKVRPIPPEK